MAGRGLPFLRVVHVLASLAMAFALAYLGVLWSNRMLTLASAFALVHVGIVIHWHAVTTTTFASRRSVYVGAGLGLFVAFGGPAVLFAFTKHREAQQEQPPASTLSSSCK